MITPEIISYVKTERQKNTPDSVITSNLLANGWAQKDISEALSSLPDVAIMKAELKKYRQKVTLITFPILLLVDAILILIIKWQWGTYGIFGIGLLAIVLRILVIYIMAAFAAHGALIEENKYLAITKGIILVIGSMALVILIGAGIFFIGCLFLFSRSGI